MSLTYNEEQRILELEEAVQSLSRLVEGAASKNMLNRMLSLSNNQIKELSVETTALETKVDQLILLAEKLQ